MILRKVTLQNWRAHQNFEMALEPGLNVLQGPNEAGKSSIVEAVEWALYTDIVGSRLKTEDVKALIPVHEPTARPTVCVELVFSDCSAVLTKILAEEAGKRECHLVIRREGVADEHFDRTDAQKRMRALFAADGLGVEKGSVAEGGLLISHQGEGAEFAADGSAVIRSTLGVAGDGTLALTKRLDRVRCQVENLRGKELMRDLETQAAQAARAGTEAARCRDELQEARAQLAHFEALEREIETLRDEIDALSLELSTVSPLEASARAQVEEMGRRQLEQLEADRIIGECEARSRETQSAREAAAGRLGEVEHLRRLQEADERELETSAVALQGVEAELQHAHIAYDAAHDAIAVADEAVEAGRGAAEAWRTCLAAYEAARSLNVERRDVETLKALGAALIEAQERLDAALKAPSTEELRGWRSAWERLQALQNEAALGLQVEIVTETANHLEWRADGGRVQNISTTPGEPATLAALGELVLDVPGWGEMRVRSGARGVEELKVELGAARETLARQLASWKLDVAALPSALDEWEARRAAWDEAERARAAAAEALRAEEARSGSLDAAAARLAEREAELETARLACAPYEGLFEMRNRTRTEVRDGCEEAENRLREAQSQATRARNEAATALQRLRDAEAALSKAAARPGELKAAMGGRAAQLERLQSDGLDLEARAASVEQLSAVLWQARQDVEIARGRRRDLGNGISSWHIEEARRSALLLAEKRSALETRLAELRRDLHHHCQQDARSQIEELRARIEMLEPQLGRHEARLRGIALLDAAIQIEGSRLGRALAGPLNEKLSPWLSSLRGKETVIEFDDTGSRIEAVRSRETTVTGEATTSLPFSAQSEGLKEQVAFALRLLLASRVARHLPSGRLPVVLDDPFTQTDAARRAGLGEVLKDAAETLQILFVTCHQDHPGSDVAANWIRLGEWRETSARRPRHQKKPEKVVPVTNGRTANGIEERAETLSLW